MVLLLLRRAASHLLGRGRWLACGRGYVRGRAIAQFLLVYDRRRLAKRYFCGSQILVTSNLLSRGIDIPNITLVINFDLPYKPNRAAGGRFDFVSRVRARSRSYWLSFLQSVPG